MVGITAGTSALIRSVTADYTSSHHILHYHTLSFLFVKAPVSFKNVFDDIVQIINFHISPLLSAHLLNIFCVKMGIFSDSGWS